MGDREPNQIVAGIVHIMDRPAATVVPDEAVCAKCGYSLRTLREDGICPECGFPVARSLLSREDRQLVVLEDRVIEDRAWYGLWRRRLTALAVAVFAVFWVVPVAISAVRQLLLTHGLYEPVSLSGLLLATLLLVAAHGCRVRCQHAEYVLACRAGGDASRSGADRRRDGRIAGRVRSYERASGGVTALLIVAILSLMFIFVWRPATQVEASQAIVWAFVAAWFVELAWINSGRLAHARSIRYYRRGSR